MSKSEEKGLAWALKTVIKKAYSDGRRPACKYCLSSNVERYGVSKRVQQYRCNSCGRKFRAGQTLPRRKASADIIAGALNCFYAGMSHRDILNNIKQQTDKDFTKVMIKNWIVQFTDKALRKTRELRPEVGLTWIVSGFELDTGAKMVQYWDVMDVDTCFLLATDTDKYFTTDQVAAIIRKAISVAGKYPEAVVTSSTKLGNRIKAEFGSRFQIITPDGYEGSDLSRRKMKPLHSLFRNRVDILHRKDSPVASQALLEGFAFDQNYLRPLDILKGKTPAEKAKIESPYKYWTDVIIQTQPSVVSHAGDTLKERHYHFKIDKRNIELNANTDIEEPAQKAEITIVATEL
jgi:transposase-like protein